MTNLILAVWAGVASAQTIDGDLPEFNAQHFRPTIDGTRTLWTDEAARGEHLKPTVQALWHYTEDPLVYDYEDGTRLGLVEDVIQADVLAAVAIDRFRLGVGPAGVPSHHERGGPRTVRGSAMSRLRPR